MYECFRCGMAQDFRGDCQACGATLAEYEEQDFTPQSDIAGGNESSCGAALGMIIPLIVFLVIIAGRVFHA